MGLDLGLDELLDERGQLFDDSFISSILKPLKSKSGLWDSIAARPVYQQPFFLGTVFIVPLIHLLFLSSGSVTNNFGTALDDMLKSTLFHSITFALDDVLKDSPNETSAAEALETVMSDYLKRYPNDLEGLSIPSDQSKSSK